MGVDDENLKVIDIEIIMENCPTTISTAYIYT